MILGRFTRVAKNTGRTYVTPIAMHLEVTGDKIAKLRLYEDSFAIAEAYE